MWYSDGREEDNVIKPFFGWRVTRLTLATHSSILEEFRRKRIVGNLKTAQQFELALPQSRSKRSSGVVNHLIVMIP